MIGIDWKAAKEGFFDRQKVIDAVDRASRNVLSKIGAFVRQRAKTSIHKRKRPSDPGNPPSSHVGLLRDLLFFSYDDYRKSVVVGPTLSNKPTGAPATLEYGGDAEIESHQFRFRGGKRVMQTVKRRVHIEPRPYMGPALEAERPGFAAMWANSVK